MASTKVETTVSLPTQYALPIHFAHMRASPASSWLYAAPQSQPLYEETRLRRKTPSGTLSAGYDASGADMLPQKYQVMSGPPTQSISRPTASNAGKLTFLEHQQRQNEQLSHLPFGWSSSAHAAMPVMDSLLNQELTYASFSPNTVPSVLHPSFQHLGPTAPASHGLTSYGPYYHDGTYVPYRPAAVRDPRFYHFNSSTWHAYPPHWPLPHNLAAASPLAPGWTREPQTSASHPLWNTQRPSLPARHNNTQHHSDTNTAWPVLSDPSHDDRSRDRIHAWALQQYRDLLSFLHRIRKHSAPSRHVPPHLQQPRYYPKPPAPRSSIQGPSVTCEVPQVASSNVEIPLQPCSLDAARRQSLPWSPQGLQMHDNEYQRRASHDQYNKQAISSFPHHDTMVQPIVQPLPLEDSPQARASLALHQITQLCQDSNWQWVDGMHLGGCLAYGLGNYAKALRWYEKVLEIDHGHLEATSNLAATYLALGRKEHAERHWIRVVKAAPNHFEAVEHLLGLLCTSQRSEAAIKVIEYVEHVLLHGKKLQPIAPTPVDTATSVYPEFDIHTNTSVHEWRGMPETSEPGFGSSGYAIPGCENGRILALIHAKGNIYYTMGKVDLAARSFEEVVLIATGKTFKHIRGLIRHVLHKVALAIQVNGSNASMTQSLRVDPILLSPEQALATAKLCFPSSGELPGLQHIPGGHQSMPRRAIISTASNSLLSLAKIYQDAMSNANRAACPKPLASGVRDILALYYLSLSLQPSPSTANNVGILLAGVQQISSLAQPIIQLGLPGVVPGSGIALALQYYNYGLQLDQNHAHLYTNLGSLLKDIGQLDAAISMYERAVNCDARFDIALANLANAVKDKGRISDAILYYRRAVDVNPQFAEAVCGLANALNSVCNWQGRGGLVVDGGRRDRWHVDGKGMLVDAKQPNAQSSGWIKHVVDIVDKQLVDGESWGLGVITPAIIGDLVAQLLPTGLSDEDVTSQRDQLRQTLQTWAGKNWEGARITRLVERATRRISWLWYQNLHVPGKKVDVSEYKRPQLPSALTVPSAPTVLPFHTFTSPMSARQIRLISQRNGVRISALTLKAPWLPAQVFMPPSPPAPYLKVGYISSDFNNHPLAHLMQSVFGMHDKARVLAHCYATTASDTSIHRTQIEAECPVFHDASTWPAERLVKQIVDDGIHILVNLNGYTRGARNEVFAARPAPIMMSFMGFAGTLGAEWCDYLLADSISIPPSTLRAWRRNIDIQDQIVDGYHDDNSDDWVYAENVIYCRDTFFCCDHKQSTASLDEERTVTWHDEVHRRWKMRQELFPHLPQDAIIFGNFNQLYKIDPTTFRTWLRILARVPNAVLWLLRFPDLGESQLRATAKVWAGVEVASRIIFTDVAPKHLHISRARICDLVLDTPECNAHTTAADVLWSGTPLLTLPRYEFKMCSRIAASILTGALPKDAQGRHAAKQLIANNDNDYEEKAVALAAGFRYQPEGAGRAEGSLFDLRKMLFTARWTSGLFDTARWVRDLEDAYHEAWRRYVLGEGGDIWLDQIQRGSAI